MSVHLEAREAQQRDTYVGTRRYRLAAYLFLAPLFVSVASFGPNEDFAIPTRVLEWVGLATLGAATVAAWATITEVRRLVGALTLLGTLAVVYELARSERSVGEPSAYTAAAMGFCVIYGLTVVYAAIFYRESDFVSAFYRLAVVSMGIAFGAWALSLATGEPFLVNFRGGGGLTGYRLQGLLAEPSAWAPIVPATLILAWRHRDRLVVLLALMVLVAAQSPTVLAVTAVSVSVYVLMQTRWEGARVPVALLMAGLIAGGVAIASSADGRTLSSSGNPAERTVGRLLVGVDAFTGAGDERDNTRLQSASAVLGAADDEGYSDLGGGLNSSSPYFETRYPGEQGYRANAIWTRAVFDVGWLGAALLVAMLTLAAVRLRRRPWVAAVFLSLICASMVNSAGGHQLYKMAVLAVLLFALRWERVPDAPAVRH